MDRKPTFILLISLLVLLTITGCAGRTYLAVDYIPRSAAGLPAGLSVRLGFVDERPTRTVILPGAAAHLTGFRGRYLLAWLTEDKERTPAGSYDLEGLFVAAFKKRMQKMQLPVAPQDRRDTPLFEVGLKSFSIDLSDRNWVVEIGYEARMIVEGRIVATETVTGSAQRIRIVGRAGAEQVVGDLFTDMINRVDIGKLLRSPGNL